jgi:L-ribulokinase
MREAYALGVDFGTNSVRALVVDTATGDEVGTFVAPYPSGQDGIILDQVVPDLARQHPADYLACLEACITGAIRDAGSAFDAGRILGIGVDTTGSTPIPVNADGTPMALTPSFADHPAAMAWLWKDHTAHEEAGRITDAARELRPEYLGKCGGVYSSEWFWAKIWGCLHQAPDVFDAAHTWVEHADWIPAVLTGTDHPDVLKRGVCAAGHKAFYSDSWGGYPDADFLAALDPSLARLAETLPERCHPVNESAGGLTPAWASKLGLKAGIPVAMGAFDAHLGAVGAGVKPGTLVKIIGTSTCDITTAPLQDLLPDIPGLCGIVPESVLPGHFGLEAGQSGVGDVFNWFVQVMQPDGKDHETLTEEAEALKPGQSGLLALDWFNGNRTVLVDQRLSGMLLGMTLATPPAHIYRALIEATAYGARVITERFAQYGVPVERVINCGGISAKNTLVMQIYADILNRPMMLSRSTQTCALGSAMAGAVVAGVHADFDAATETMTGIQETIFYPIPENVAVYETLFGLYKRLHDAFGVARDRDDLSDVMKTLLDVRDRANRHPS